MPRFRVKIHEAVWQITSFECEAASRELAEEHAFELHADDVEIEDGDNVEGIDAEIEVEPVSEDVPCPP